MKKPRNKNPRVYIPLDLDILGYAKRLQDVAERLQSIAQYDGCKNIYDVHKLFLDFDLACQEISLISRAFSQINPLGFRRSNEITEDDYHE